MIKKQAFLFGSDYCLTKISTRGVISVLNLFGFFNLYELGVLVDKIKDYTDIIEGINFFLGRHFFRVPLVSFQSIRSKTLALVQFPEHHDRRTMSSFDRQLLKIRGEAIIILRKCAKGSIETRQGNFHNTIISQENRRKEDTRKKREEEEEKDDSLNGGGI